MGEMNSISCGGEAGVSDIFASALWAADAMFEFANESVDGVNIHTGTGGGYALFTFNFTTANYTLSSVRPEYYGLLLFQAAAPAGCQLLPVNIASSSNVKAWASVDPAGMLRITLINKDESAGGNMSVQVPTSGSAALTRLVAPGLSAQTGITFGGQSFDGSTDGTLQGTAVFETVAPTSSGYTVAVPPLSAALLTIGGS
jgi:glycosyl hydrolase family 79